MSRVTNDVFHKFRFLSNYADDQPHERPERIVHTAMDVSCDHLSLILVCFHSKQQLRKEATVAKNMCISSSIFVHDVLVRVWIRACQVTANAVVRLKVLICKPECELHLF